MVSKAVLNLFFHSPCTGDLIALFLATHTRNGGLITASVDPQAAATG